MKRGNSRFKSDIKIKSLPDSKRSQVTGFVLVAVLVVVAVIIYFFVKGDVIDFGRERVDPEIKGIYSFVESCVKEVGEDAVVFIGNHGGYYNVPEGSLQLNTTEVPYYFDKGVALMPRKEQVADQLSLYVDENLNDCTDFSGFSDFKIQKGDVSTSTVIEDNEVIYNVNYLLSISKGDRTYQLDSFENIKIPVRLGVLYDNIVIFIIGQLQDPTYVCLSCLYTLSVIDNFYVDAFEIDDETTMFFFRDNVTRIDGNEYVYTFANRYEKAEVPK